MLSSIGSKLVFVGRLIFFAACLLFCELQKHATHHDAKVGTKYLFLSSIMGMIQFRLRGMAGMQATTLKLKLSTQKHVN